MNYFIERVPTNFIIENMDMANKILLKLDGLVVVRNWKGNLEASVKWKWGKNNDKDYLKLTLHDVLVKMYFFNSAQRTYGILRQNNSNAQSYIAGKTNIPKLPRWRKVINWLR